MDVKTRLHDFGRNHVIINNVHKTLNEFLNNHKVNDEKDETTHVSMTGMYGGRWNIKDEELNEFYKLYINEIANKRELHIVEHHDKKYGPIIIDLDIKQKKAERQITKEHIKKIVGHLTNYMMNTFSIDENYTCYILQRPEPYYDVKNKYYKDGIHIHFPYIITTFNYQHIMRSVYLDILKEDLNGVEYINTIDEVYDSMVIESVGLCMYLSTKKGILAYEITEIINNKDEEKKSIIELLNLLSIRGKTKLTEYKNKEVMEKLEGDVKIMKNQEIINKKGEQLENNHDKKLELNKEMFVELLNILSQERIDNYSNWINVIFLCKTYGCYDEIITISKKSSKYDTKSLNIINNIFKKDNKSEKQITIGSLRRWASEDNPDKVLLILEKYNMKKELELKIIDDYLLYKISPEKYDHIEDSKYISDDALYKMCNKILDSHDKNEHIIFVIHGSTGIGKTLVTKKIINYYLTLDKNAKILSTISRQTMSCNHKNVFEEFNMISYLDQDISNQDRYICSLENLPKIYDEYYDILILDEIQNLIKHIWSSTMDTKRFSAFIKLINVIKDAKLIIASDANITNMVISFIEKWDKNIYYYRNITKNKLEVKMNIYRSDHKSENAKLYKFCQMMESDVKNKKSILIFSDNKSVTIKIRELLRKYCDDDNYFMYINKENGSLMDITNCNQTFLNKCVLISPKMIYGNDITIKYENIYCVYKYTNVSNYMSGLEYHQQYSRSRNTQYVNILALESKEMTNNFISFEKSKEEDEEEYRSYNKEINQKCEKYNVLNDLCSTVTINGININKDALFTDVYFYKSWYDKIFSRNKLQIMCKMAEEAGYEIINHKLEVTESCEGLNKAIKKYKDTIKNATVSILNNKKINKNEEINKNKETNNLETQIKHKIKMLGDSLNEKEIEELLLDDKKYITYFNKKLLDISKEAFCKYELEILKIDLSYIAKDNKIINRVKNLYWLEEQLMIERYDIDKIKIDDLDKMKKILLDNINKLTILYDENTSKPKLSSRIIKKINKILSPLHINKFVIDIYNTFGNILKCERKDKYIKLDNKYVHQPYYVYSKY